MLKHLDLSWNGFGNEGALALGEALKFNNTLVHLNLNNNRLTNEGVGMLCRGVEFNDTLRVLQVGGRFGVKLTCVISMATDTFEGDVLFFYTPVVGLQLFNSRGSTGPG